MVVKKKTELEEDNDILIESVLDNFASRQLEDVRVAMHFVREGTFTKEHVPFSKMNRLLSDVSIIANDLFKGKYINTSNRDTKLLDELYKFYYELSGYATEAGIRDFNQAKRLSA